MKVCSKCKIEKDLSCFSQDKSQKSGRVSHCKLCIKEYQQTNRDKILLVKKKWRQENKQKNTEYKRKYDKNRKKTDIVFKVRQNVSCQIRKYLKKNSSNKRGSSYLNSIPYTIQELRDHLEKQFDHNMNWDNYGRYWEIDHIIPQSLLPYTSMSDDNFKKCWALDNLQPLEKIANIKKSNKIVSIL